MVHEVCENWREEVKKQMSTNYPPSQSYPPVLPKVLGMVSWKSLEVEVAVSVLSRLVRPSLFRALGCPEEM